MRASASHIAATEPLTITSNIAKLPELLRGWPLLSLFQIISNALLAMIRLAIARLVSGCKKSSARFELGAATKAIAKRPIKPGAIAPWRYGKCRCG
jgi:hypothetical protein